jgi:hypothetical protein
MDFQMICLFCNSENEPEDDDGNCPDCGCPPWWSPELELQDMMEESIRNLTKDREID